MHATGCVRKLDPVLDESLIKETESNIEGLEQKAQALNAKRSAPFTY